jgi:hypothetical protein
MMLIKVLVLFTRCTAKHLIQEVSTGQFVQSISTGGEMHFDISVTVDSVLGLA